MVAKFQNKRFLTTAFLDKLTKKLAQEAIKIIFQNENTLILKRRAHNRGFVGLK